MQKRLRGCLPGLLILFLTLLSTLGIGLDFQVPRTFSRWQNGGYITNRQFNTILGPLDKQLIFYDSRLIPTSVTNQYLVAGGSQYAYRYNSQTRESKEIYVPGLRLNYWPESVTYDPNRQRNVLVTLGAASIYDAANSPGALFELSVSNVWTQMAQLQKGDYIDSIVYFPPDNCLYGLEMANGSPTNIARIFNYDSLGRKIATNMVPLFPRNLSLEKDHCEMFAVQDKIVLLFPQYNNHRGPTRIYVFDPASGSVELTFEDHGPDAPYVQSFYIDGGTVVKLGQAINGKLTVSDQNGNLTDVKIISDSGEIVREWSVSTNSSQILTFDFSWIPTHHGESSLYAIARDAVGLTNQLSVIQVRTVMPPTIRWVSPSPVTNMIVGDSAVLDFEVSDPEDDLRSLELIDLMRGTFRFESFPTNYQGTNVVRFPWNLESTGAFYLQPRVRDRTGLMTTGEVLRVFVNARADSVHAPFIQRGLPKFYRSGEPVDVWITAQPGGTATNWSVEEQPPSGWRVSVLNEAGRFDPATRKIFWGPFTNNLCLTLVYQATPPPGDKTIASFSGSMRADGVIAPIAGNHLLPPSEIPIANANRAPSGRVSLGFNVAPGESFLVEGADSIDSTNWIPISAITGGDTPTELPEIDPDDRQKFYRVRPVP
jgi:hypothetical protein